MISKWDIRYMNLAKEISTWSKDSSTRLGAVAIKDKRILSTGFNGFPRGIEDSDNRLNDRELKYGMIVHAEQNCIYNATYHGLSLKDSDIFVYGLPICNDCAKGIIQVGIKRVIMTKIREDDKWNESWNITKQMFDEVGIEYEFLELYK
jgi:dCMP deaminase